MAPLGNLHQSASSALFVSWTTSGLVLLFVCFYVGEVGAAICALSIVWSLLQGERGKHIAQMISRRKD
jgi:hypothetical protein